jgi:hypothetical protein
MIGIRTADGRLFGPFGRSLGRLLRRLAWVAVVLAAVAAVGFAVLSAAASHRLRKEEAAWAESFGTLDLVAERYPARGANDTALELEALGREIGVTLAPRAFWEDRPRAPRDTEAALRGAAGAFWRYLRDCLEDPGPDVPAPPPELLAFLSESRKSLDAIVARLREGESPRWDVDLGASGGAPLPNLGGHIRLQELLLARALERAVRRDGQGASEALEGAWNLNRALWDRPDTDSRFLAIGWMRKQAAALRKVDAAPAGWGARLAALDVGSASAAGVIGDAYAWRGAPAPPPG